MLTLHDNIYTATLYKDYEVYVECPVAESEDYTGLIYDKNQRLVAKFIVENPKICREVCFEVVDLLESDG